jgi:uncharacterized protein YjdB
MPKRRLGLIVTIVTQLLVLFTTQSCSDSNSGLSPDAEDASRRGGQGHSKIAQIAVTVTPTAVTPTTTAQATAVARDASGNVISGLTFLWSSSNTSVANISANGVVIGEGLGTASILAWVYGESGVTGSAPITVANVVPARMQVAIDSTSLTIPHQAQATAVTFDTTGVAIGGPVTWNSSDMTIATITSAGVITAVSPGTVTINASSNGVRGSATIKIVNVGTPTTQVGSVAVSLVSGSIGVGATTQGIATVYDTSRAVIANRAVTWSSSNTSVATVNSTTGVVTGVSAGTASIAATTSGVAGSATISVTAAADTQSPTVAITAPTSGATFATNTSSITLSGTASDSVGVTQVTWTTSTGASGTATGTTSWSVANIGLHSGANIITVTAHDAANNVASKTLTVTYTTAGSTDTQSPTIAITAPTSGATFATSTSPMTLSGTSSDNVGVTQVTWTTSTGGSGTATVTTSWSVANIGLHSGANIITVTAHDAANNVASKTLTVTYSASGQGPAASRVGITTQPSTTAQSGAAFAQQPVLQLRDSSNNPVSQSGVAVTAAVASGGGTLGGTATVTTDGSGVATFTNLSITGTTGSRTLSFTAASLTGATSNAVLVTASPSPPPVATGMYFNSSEPGCDGSNANVLWCDDFERGYWFKTTADAFNAANAGWNGTPYGDVDPLGLNFGRCSGAGVGGGTSCAATNGGHTGIGQARAMADHSLSQSVTEVYFRYYVKPLPGYAAGQEKAITFNKGLAGVGGIYAGTVFYGLGAAGSNPNPQPTFLEENHPGGAINLDQNQGTPFGLVTGHWNAIQVRLKFVAPGSDIVQMWMDDCGTDGTACTGTPTLRMSYSNETLSPASDSSPSIGSIWLENWANPESVGEMYYDQIKVAKTGPIGFKP